MFLGLPSLQTRIISCNIDRVQLRTCIPAPPLESDPAMVRIAVALFAMSNQGDRTDMAELTQGIYYVIVCFRGF